MKIFITGLPLQVGEAELREVFGDFGEVKSLKIITDRQTRQSRGFGFVEMPNEEEARHAIRNMNGGDYYGNRILVTEARDDRDGDGGRSNHFTGNSRKRSTAGH